MAAEDPTTWGEICRKVGFSDNLHRDCRKNVPDYPLGGAPNSAFDSMPEEEDWGPGSAGFDKDLAASALAVPPPPGADWKSEPKGFFEKLPIKQVLMYGGVAAVIWFLIARARKGAEQGAVSTTTSAPAEKAASPRAA